MEHRAGFAATTIFAAFALLAGCGNDPTAGAPAAPSTTPSTPALPQDGAPNVESPLNTAAIDTAPCSAVSKEKIETLGGKLRSSKEENAVLNPGDRVCTWIFESGMGTIGANTSTDNNIGISSLYSLNKLGKLTVFQPTAPIEGYPGVIYSDQASTRIGDCTLAVGLRNDHSYIVHTSLRSNHPNYSNPCEVATKVAAFTIQSLRGKQ
jgi:hypothetical protein